MSRTNLQKIAVGILVAGLSVTPTGQTLAQSRRPSGVASLGEMGCQTTGGRGGYREGYQAVNEDVAIGRELFRSVAYLGNRNYGQNYYGVYRDHPIVAICRLAAANASPKFKTLSLSFGFSQTSDLLDGSVVVRLSVYKDGNLYGEQTISRGDKIRWPINVQGARTIALEAECVRAKQESKSCPNIWFFEDILRR